MAGPDELTTPAVLDRMAAALPHHPALIDGDRTFTFAELRAEVRRAAAALMAAGVAAGDRVAVALPNTWQWVVAALGTHHAGGVLVPLNTAFTATETTDVLARSRARMLIRTSDSAEVDRAGLPELIHVVPGGFLTGPGVSPAGVNARAAAVHPDDVADILFTSGTTGRSKGVLCTHRQALSTSAAAAAMREMVPADRYLGVVPFFHNYGYKDGILSCLQTGATLVPQRSFDPEQTMRLIAEHRITVLTGPPVMFEALLDHPKRAHHDLSSLRVAGTGGTTVPAALVARMISDLGFDSVRTGYGLTEASGFGTATGVGLDPHTVIDHARRHLAGYKIPRSITFCDDLPRTPTGKIRKTELRSRGTGAPPLGITPRGLGGPPVGPVEDWVADAWQVLLNIPRPGRRDRFVDLGGDSLTAAEFAAMLHAQLGITMSLDALAHRPTIAAIVAGLDNAGTDHRRPVVSLRTDLQGPVCLMIPGIGGHAWKFLALANALSGPCEVLALSLVDLRRDLSRGSPDSIRDRIRRTALETLTTVAAQGRPIMIAGYSFGAMIAADLTSWLIDHGIPVTKLLLIDPDPPDSDVPVWNPRTSHMSAPKAVVFSPGSAAARQLDEDMSEVAVLLQTAYLNSTIRLPGTAVAWVQSRGIAQKYPRARTLFGTPMTQIDRTRLDLGHFDIVEIPGVHQLAAWLDRQLSTPTST